MTHRCKALIYEGAQHIWRSDEKMEKWLQPGKAVAWEVPFNAPGCSWPSSNEHRQRLEYQHGISSSDPNSSKSHLTSLVLA